MASSTTTNSFYTEQMNFILLNQAAPLSGTNTFYVGLLTTGTTYANALNQSYSEVPTGVGYTRVPIARAAGTQGVVGWTFNGSTLEFSNSADLVYGVPTQNWGTVVAIGLFRTAAINSADMMYYAGLTTSKTVNGGDGAPKILAAQLRIARASC